ncbi:hypothetical protein SAMN05421810_11237 [Amycolatopsis arida]|uniref:SMI1/KNR4 family protein n=1 Tax=Amycolatopsis arida TaxID=587909 RepID=A0A1I6ADR2_9PSEU|nr:hypothetical protein [Amycolatopsis arida]TDX97659.1 hypothetical protein CLV69_102763 [Amycolatopsis arida]SFQ66848.1 hypothetical protein SAMN05421810_11237 [Amycolatopsis arida]
MEVGTVGGHGVVWDGDLDVVGESGAYGGFDADVGLQARHDQPRPVELDADSEPLAELAGLLSRLNGFYLGNAGVQIFRAGDPGVGPELQTWNAAHTWKHTYHGLADNLFCFGQDLFGVQFAIEDRRRVVAFDPETAHRDPLGDTLHDWAA